MTPDHWQILAYKVVLIAAFVSLVSWVVIYTRLTHGAAWRNPVGRSLLVKTSLIAAVIIPSTLSVFLDLSRRSSVIVGWVDVALIGLVTPVMLWRSAVWIRLARAGDRKDGSQDPAAETTGDPPRGGDS